MSITMRSRDDTRRLSVLLIANQVDQYLSINKGNLTGAITEWLAVNWGTGLTDQEKGIYSSEIIRDLFDFTFYLRERAAGKFPSMATVSRESGAQPGAEPAKEGTL